MLGVGASVTLAAWTDSEHSQATFEASTFGIEGSVTGVDGSFEDHVNEAATLAFTPEATAMAPGTTVYALFSVRTTEASSVAGHVLLNANDATNATGLGEWLTYGVNSMPTTTCNEGTFGNGTEVVAAGTAITQGAETPQSIAANGGQINYCFAITLPTDTPNDAQGEELVAEWEFVATSTAP